MYFDVSAQGEREGKLWQNCPSHFNPIFQKTVCKLWKLLKGTSGAKVNAKGQRGGDFEGNINGVAAIEVGSERGARLVWRFFAVAVGFLSCSGEVELLFRFDR